MFFLVSGGPAAGKSTVAKQISNRLENVICHDQDERNASNGFERCQQLEEYVQLALKWQQEGYDFLLAGNSPLGELLACPSAHKLTGISACLLDCHDHVRVQRFRARGIHPQWPLSQHILNWASWHRMHAWDPRWEQDVITGSSPQDHRYDRWADWQQSDARWDVRMIDTTAVSVEQMLAQVAEWVKSDKARASLLNQEARWWE